MYNVYIQTGSGLQLVESNLSYAAAIALKVKLIAQGKRAVIQNTDNSQVGKIFDIEGSYKDKIFTPSEVLERIGITSITKEKKLPSNQMIATYVTVIVIVIILFNFKR